MPLLLNSTTWWLLAASLVVVCSLTSSLWLILGIAVVVLLLLWLNAVGLGNGSTIKVFGSMAAWVVLVRLGFRVIFGGLPAAQDVPLLNLPLITINTLGGPIRLLGTVWWSSLYSGLIDGLRFAAIILTVGVAAAFASPRRLVKLAPASLYDFATALAIALNLAPQLIASYQRVSRAMQLRGDSSGVRAVGQTIGAVLEDAFALSLSLAASMESRGFGRAGAIRRRNRALVQGANVAALVALGAGVVVLASGLAQAPIGLALLFVGVLLIAVAVRIADLHRPQTRYLVEKVAPSDVAVRVLCLVMVAAVWLETGLLS